jgi:hypothetical protein
MASIVLKLFERISYLLRAAVRCRRRRVSVVWHRLRACAAGLQAADSTVGSKEPNILANYLRAKPGFDDCARFYRYSSLFPLCFCTVFVRAAAAVPGYSFWIRCVSGMDAQ